MKKHIIAAKNTLLFVGLVFACFTVFDGGVGHAQDESLDENGTKNNLFRSLNQEEINILKNQRVTYNALWVIDKHIPKYSYEGQGGYARNTALSDTARALQRSGQKDAAKIVLKLTLESFAETPMMTQPDVFLNYLTSQTDGSGFSPDDVYTEEFIALMCKPPKHPVSRYTSSKEISEQYQRALSIVLSQLIKHQKIDLAWTFLEKYPSKESRNNAFKDFMRQLPQEFDARVDRIKDETLRKEMKELRKKTKTENASQDVMEEIRSALISPHAMTQKRIDVLDIDTKTILETIQNSTAPLDQGQGYVFLAIRELENNHVKKSFEYLERAKKIWHDNNLPSQMGYGPAYRVGTHYGLLMYYSKLARKFLSEGRYAEAVERLLEGTEIVSEEMAYNWTRLLDQPLREMVVLSKDETKKERFRRVLSESARKIAAEKPDDRLSYDNLLKSRAILEMQLNLGLEDDAKVLMNDTKEAVCLDRENKTVVSKIWNNPMIALFQVKCGLTEEMKKTLTQVTFQDEPGHVPSDYTDRTGLYFRIANELLKHEQFDEAYEMINQIRQAKYKTLALYHYASELSRVGQYEKAVETLESLDLPINRSTGLAMLATQMMDPDSGIKTEPSQIEELWDKAVEQALAVEPVEKRYTQLNSIVALTHGNGLEKKSADILEKFDSRFHKCWTIIGLIPYHEMTDVKIVAGTDSFGNTAVIDLIVNLYSPHHIARGGSSVRLPWTFDYWSQNCEFIDAESLITSERKVQEAKELLEKTRSQPKIAKATATEEIESLLKKAERNADLITDSLEQAAVYGRIAMEYVLLGDLEKAKELHRQCFEILKKVDPVQDYPTDTEVAFPRGRRQVLNFDSLCFNLIEDAYDIGESKLGLDVARLALFGKTPETISDDEAVEKMVRSDISSTILAQLAKCGDPETAMKFCDLLEKRLAAVANKSDNATANRIRGLATIKQQIALVQTETKSEDKESSEKSKKQAEDAVIRQIKDSVNEKSSFYVKMRLHSVLHQWSSTVYRQRHRAGIMNPESTLDKGSKRTYRGGFWGNPYYREPRIIM